MVSPDCKSQNFRLPSTRKVVVTTRHFAKARIKNVKPIVTLGPDFTINEGEKFEISGYFTDQNWLDKHSATFDFGDNTAPKDVPVVETNNSPQASGEASTKHFYCDNGTFTITLTIRDDAGGIGIARMKATVLNVPPKIVLPKLINTIVDQCLNLNAEFTDPGWCDTHIGYWDPGDCTRKRSVVIKETHEAPEGKGTAEIIHYYKKCGKFVSHLDIIDDDGGIGSSDMIVNAYELKNPSMEDGFRSVPFKEGDDFIIANEWYPYFSRVDSLDPKDQESQSQVGIDFSANEILCRDGQRAQCIEIRGAAQGGVLQQVPANKDWDYEFTAFYHLALRANAKVQIGIDPTGGVDSASPDIIWVKGDPAFDWLNLSVRATAQSDKITLFMGGIQHRSMRNTVYWDRAAIYQHPTCKKEKKEDEVCKDVCIDFTAFQQQVGISITSPFQYKRLLFTPLGQTLQFTTLGDPPNQIKLGFPRQGAQIDYPHSVNEVSITVNNYAGRLIVFQILGTNNQVIRTSNEIIYNEVKTFQYTDNNMHGIRVLGGDNEASVVEICLCLKDTTDEREK